MTALHELYLSMVLKPMTVKLFKSCDTDDLLLKIFINFVYLTNDNYKNPMTHKQIFTVNDRSLLERKPGYEIILLRFNHS